MRAAVLLIAAALAARAGAEAIVKSPAPERVSVTIYRDTARGAAPLNLEWLGGYALVSETRRISLPAGESELRFEGVTSGIVPQSAIVTGLGEGVIEKNRDARLLSPGALLDASLGERVHLRRTSKATGSVEEQDAIVRATNEGVIIQTAAGTEALRCTGLPETLIADRVPADLSATPTLSVRVRSPSAIEREVTLSYITNNFDWQANYVADLAADGRTVSLFGWLTMANGDQTGLAGAQTQAVAGKLNRQRVWVDPGQAKPITINCWPQATTSDIPEESRQLSQTIVVTGSRLSAYAPPSVAPPPAPPPMPERGGGEDMVAREEKLGDVRLYRIPIAVTVAARSQKQIAMIKQASVKVESVYRLRPPPNEFESALERVLLTRNDKASGLGLALPSGGVALFTKRGDRRILIGEGRIDDYTIGEKVEVRVGEATGMRAHQSIIYSAAGNTQVLTLSNDAAAPRIAEIELPLGATAVKGKLVKRDGWMLWRTSVPGNGRAELRYRM